jgi:amidase
MPVRSVIYEHNPNCAKLSPRLDTAGPMGKSTWDIAAMLEILSNAPEGFYTRHTATPNDNIGKYRLGVARKFFPPWSNMSLPANEDIKEEVEEVFAKTVAKLAAGIKLDPADIQGIQAAWSAGQDQEKQDAEDARVTEGPNGRLFLTEYLGAIERFFQDDFVDSPIQTVTDLIEWNSAHPASHV